MTGLKQRSSMWSFGKNTAILLALVSLLVTQLVGGCAGGVLPGSHANPQPSPLAITSNSVPPAKAQTAYSATLTATGGTAPYTWSLASGSLPVGLSLSSSGGQISGTPSQAGSFSFTVEVTDSSAPVQSAKQQLSIPVAAVTTPIKINTSTLPSGQIAATYSTTLAATGGTTPYNWSVSAGALPAGLALSTTGTISGTPTASGSFSFTVKVTDSTTPTAETATQSLTLAIGTVATPVQITTSSVSSGRVGTAYSTTLEATGGTTPYSWSVSAGALPAGLALSTTGTISGTPTAMGTFSFTIKVSDSGAPATTASGNFSITITAASSYAALLDWTASTSSGISGYNVYRSTVSGSGYVQINSSLVAASTYTDATVVSGQTYYYVTTAVDASGEESTYSDEVQAVIP